MNHYIPVSTDDGTVIVRSSENACVSVCCIFSTIGDLEIARFDNGKIAKSLCEIWNDANFQQCRPFFGNTFCLFICEKDMQNREIYDLMDHDTAHQIEQIRSQFMIFFAQLFLTNPELFHESLVNEIANMN
jgi:hypothetical protein